MSYLADGIVRGLIFTIVVIGLGSFAFGFALGSFVMWVIR